MSANPMTPDPTGIEALLCELEALQNRPSSPQHHDIDNYEEWVDALTEAFPELVAALRSQSRALAEREETIAALKVKLAHLHCDPRDCAYAIAEDDALASAPKGEGEG